MTEADALIELGDQDLVTFRSGSIPDMKQLRDRCLAEDVAVTVGCPPSTGKS